MKYSEDRMWSAYLDGELSAAEAAEFDRGLTPAARQRLEGETRLENALGEKLRSGSDCPDALWNSIRTQIDTPPVTAQPNSIVRWAKLTAAAAGIAVALSLGLFWGLNNTQTFLQAETQRAELVPEVETSGEDMANYLEEHGIRVAVLPLNSLHTSHARRAKAIGAREVMYKGQPVVELVYECCHQPVMIVVAPQNTPGAAAIQDDAEGYPVKEVGNAVATVVGHHTADYLLGVLADSRGSV